MLPSRFAETALQAEQITQRLSVWPQGVVPYGCEVLTAAMDLGKYLCHWVIVAWEDQARGQIIDYGRIEVASIGLGVEKALTLALEEFRDLILAGWPAGSNPQEPSEVKGTRVPVKVFVDAGYMTDVVYAFCRSRPGPFLPAVGRGATQQRISSYQRPSSTGSIVTQIGEGYHLARQKPSGVTLVEVDADHWKSWVHQRLATPLSEASAMTLFQAAPREHLSLAKHLTAEKKTEEFVPGKGTVTRWERLRKQNHWLDALYNACCAGHLAGVRLLPTRQLTPPPPQDTPSQSWPNFGRRMRGFRFAKRNKREN